MTSVPSASGLSMGPKSSQRRRRDAASPCLSHMAGGYCAFFPFLPALLTVARAVETATRSSAATADSVAGGAARAAAAAPPARFHPFWGAILFRSLRLGLFTTPPTNVPDRPPQA